MWKSVQAYIQGRSHKKNDTPCQDRTFHLKRNGVDVIALADGAGSANLSDKGAEAAVTRIAEIFCENFDEIFTNPDAADVRQYLIDEIVNRLYVLSESLDCELSDLASTLLGVAVKDDRYVIIHIGDGVIGYYSQGELRVASNPENGEFINTTVFTTSPDAQNQMHLFKGNLNDIEGFVMFSDGPEKVLYNYKSQTILPSLTELMEDLQSKPENIVEADLKETLEEIGNVSFDDCSLIAMARTLQSEIEESCQDKLLMQEENEPEEGDSDNVEELEDKNVNLEDDENGYIQESAFSRLSIVLSVSFVILIVVFWIILT